MSSAQHGEVFVVVVFGGFSFYDGFSNFLQFSSETSGLPKNRNMNKNPRVSGGGLFTVIEYLVD